MAGLGETGESHTLKGICAKLESLMSVDLLSPYFLMKKKMIKANKILADILENIHKSIRKSEGPVNASLFSWVT